MMSRLVRSVLVGTLVAGGLLAVAPSASAAPCVRIYRIYYNSPGKDDRSNKSLNAEWIPLRNYCGTSRALTNWRIKDVAGHKYVFGTFRLGGGKYVKVHTGHGTNTATDRYWGSGNYIWNNDKDTAYLRNRFGNLVDRCSYNNPSASYVYC